MKLLEFPTDYTGQLKQFVDGKTNSGYSNHPADWLISFVEKKNNRRRLLGNGLIFNLHGLGLVPLDVLTDFYSSKDHNNCHILYYGYEFKLNEMETLYQYEEEGLCLIKLDTNETCQNTGLQLYPNPELSHDKIKIIGANIDGKLFQEITQLSKSEFDASAYYCQDLEQNFPAGSLLLTPENKILGIAKKDTRKNRLYTYGPASILGLFADYSSEIQEETRRNSNKTSHNRR